MSESNLKIGVTTDRRQFQHFSLQVQYDFEDALCEATGGSLIEIPPPQRKSLPRRILRKISIENKIIVPEIEKGLDLLFIPCMWPAQIDLGHIANWRSRCNKIVVYLFDAWPVDHKSGFLKNTYVDEVDLVVISYYESLRYFQNLLSPKVMWLPQAVKPDRFFYKTPPRGIFCSAMGRQDEVFFRKMQQYCKDHDLLFIYQGEIGRYRRTWQDSYTLYANLLRNSKYTLNWSCKTTQPHWESGFCIDPPTCRWFEAAAAGSLQVGIPPDSPVYSALFPEEPVIDLRKFDSDPVKVFEYLEHQSEAEWIEKTTRLSRHVLSKHTWYNRVFTILCELGMREVFRLPPSKLLLDYSPIMIENEGK